MCDSSSYGFVRSFVNYPVTSIRYTDGLWDNRFLYECALKNWYLSLEREKFHLSRVECSGTRERRRISHISEIYLISSIFTSKIRYFFSFYAVMIHFLQVVHRDPYSCTQSCLQWAVSYRKWPKTKERRIPKGLQLECQCKVWWPFLIGSKSDIAYQGPWKEHLSTFPN